ncbi:hypothetical protein [Aquimarina longa]|uniref:hypothetical protein n=1 Tax=Aquimarina longa TaxID=1080221 RepID=UPI00078027DC|nr:hypothetical protein [Aquimarina longa]
MEKITNREFLDLQQNIDKLVCKFGISKAIDILEQLSKDPIVEKAKKQWDQLFFTFILSEASSIFEGANTIEDDGSFKKYSKEVRMASYYLLKQHTSLSYHQIGQHFNDAKSVVHYHTNKCREYISMPQLNRPFVKKYTVLEKSILQFIAKISS